MTQSNKRKSEVSSHISAHAESTRGSMVEWAVILGAIFVLIIIVIGFLGKHIDRRVILAKAQIAAASNEARQNVRYLGPFGTDFTTAGTLTNITKPERDLLNAACGHHFNANNNTPLSFSAATVTDLTNGIIICS